MPLYRGTRQVLRSSAGPINLIKKPHDFSDAIWTKTNVTAAPDNALAPDGTMTACLMTGVNGGSCIIWQRVVNTSQDMTASMYLKGGTREEARGILRNDITETNLASAALTFADGSIIGGWTVETLPNSWYRISIRVSSGINGDELLLYVGGGGTTITAGETWYQWGAQLQHGSLTAFRASA